MVAGCRRRREIIQTTATTAIPMTARPPITPPTMAPTGGPELDPDPDPAGSEVVLASLSAVVAGFKSVLDVFSVALDEPEVRVRIGGVSSKVPMPPLV